MDRIEILKLESIVRTLHSEVGSFKDVSEIYDISTADIVHLLFDTEEGKEAYFKDKNFDHLPIFNPNV